MLLFVLASKLEAAASCISKKVNSNYSLKLKTAVWVVKKHFHNTDESTTVTVYTNWHLCCINRGEFHGFSSTCIYKPHHPEFFIFVPVSHVSQPEAENRNLKGLILAWLQKTDLMY